MKPKLEDLYLQTDDGLKLPVIELFKDDCKVFFKLEREPEHKPRLPRFCGLKATMGSGRNIDFVVNTETNEVVAFAILPDGCNHSLLSDALSEYTK